MGTACRSEAVQTILVLTRDKSVAFSTGSASFSISSGMATLAALMVESSMLPLASTGSAPSVSANGSKSMMDWVEGSLGSGPPDDDEEDEDEEDEDMDWLSKKKRHWST